MQTMKITRKDLLNKIINWRKEISSSGVSFAKLCYVVDEYDSKTVYGEKILKKEVECVVTLGSSYRRKCKRILEKQGIYIDINNMSMGIPGRHYLINSRTPLVVADTDPNRVYLTFIREHHIHPHVKYFYRGEEISQATAIEQNMFRNSYFQKEKTPANGLIDEKYDFKMRTLKFEHIKKLQVGGVEYEVID